MTPTPYPPEKKFKFAILRVMVRFTVSFMEVIVSCDKCGAYVVNLCHIPFFLVSVCLGV